MVDAVDGFGPRVTVPAAKVLLNISWVTGPVPVSVNPVSVHVESSHAGLPALLSMPTNTSACWLMVNVTGGLPVYAFEPLASRIQVPRISMDGAAVRVYVRSP